MCTMVLVEGMETWFQFLYYLTIVGYKIGEIVRFDVKWTI